MIPTQNSRFLSIFIVVFNVIWLFSNLRLIFRYEHSEILWFVLLPYWFIVMNIIFSLCGIIIGVYVYNNKINSSHAVAYNLSLIFVSIAIELFIIL